MKKRTIESLRQEQETTRGAMDWMRLEEEIQELLDEEEKDKIRQTIKNIESFTAGLDTFIQNYQNIISDKDKDNFQSTLQNWKNITSELNNGINKEIIKLDQILDDVKSVTDKSDEISTTISELRKSSESISNVIEKLDQIFSNLENGKGTLGKLINDETLHNNMNNLVNEIKAVVEDFKDNPTKYMRAYWKGKKK